MPTTALSIRHARFPDDLDQVVAIFREYIASPKADLGFQNSEAELAALPGKYAAPQGRLLLAWQGDAVVGRAALRAVDGECCELKRVYVRPAARACNWAGVWWSRCCKRPVPRVTSAWRWMSCPNSKPRKRCTANWALSMRSRSVSTGAWNRLSGPNAVVDGIAAALRR